jgi:hypothetical protein
MRRPLATLHALVIEDPHATLCEDAGRWAERTGVRGSNPVRCEALKRLKRTRKKTLRAAEQDRPEIAAERQAYRQQLAEIGADRLVFVDESGITTTMTRTHARAPRGERASAAAPFGCWQPLTILGALSTEGVVAEHRGCDLHAGVPCLP